ncbi:MAG: HDOD domain-containing protein [Myxococcales bacterium]|nr:HDOD domain-containing protein [Myxococcales bacterium]
MLAFVPVAEGPQLLDRAVDSLRARGELPLLANEGVTARLLALLARDDWSVADLGALVRSDQALVVAVLHAASSAASGGAVESLRVAITRLGTRRLARVALGVSVGRRACAPGPLQALRLTAWREALATALVSQTLAKRRGEDAGDAYLIGLLANIGVTIALCAFEELRAEGLDELMASRSAAAWLALVERYQILLADEAFRCWKLPPQVVRGIGSRSATLEDARRVAGLLRQHTSLGEAELSATGITDSAEQRELLALVRNLPRMIAAMSGDPHETYEHSGLLVLAPAAPRATGAREGDAQHARLTASVPRGNGDLERYDVMQLTSECLLLLGAPLAQGALARVVIEPADDEPLSMWVNVVSVAPRDDSWLAEVVPFALDPETAARWRRLIDPTKKPPSTQDTLFIDGDDSGASPLEILGAAQHASATQAPSRVASNARKEAPPRRSWLRRLF